MGAKRSLEDIEDVFRRAADGGLGAEEDHGALDENWVGGHGGDHGGLVGGGESEGFVGGFAAAEKLLCREAEGFEGCANLGLVGLVLQVEADLWCQPSLIEEGEGLALLGAAGVVPDGQVHVSRPLPTASATLA